MSTMLLTEEEQTPKDRMGPRLGCVIARAAGLACERPPKVDLSSINQN